MGPWGLTHHLASVCGSSSSVGAAVESAMEAGFWEGTGPWVGGGRARVRWRLVGREPTRGGAAAGQGPDPGLARAAARRPGRRGRLASEGARRPGRQHDAANRGAGAGTGTRAVARGRSPDWRLFSPKRRLRVQNESRGGPAQAVRFDLKRPDAPRPRALQATAAPRSRAHVRGAGRVGRTDWWRCCFRCAF